LAFRDPDTEKAVEEDQRRRWPAARWVRDDAATAPVARSVFARPAVPGTPLAVLVRGTNFQVQVWRALLRIPEGSVASYESVAAAAGRPAAVRAAAGAVGDNPVAWLVPCHRVLRKSGLLGGYRWGLERKRAMLAWEAARTG
jgi:O-6-methylguanine DNA methyltransferase